MKPDEINAAIAESQGWHRIQWNEDSELTGYSPTGTLRDPIPNYHDSLDAIVPAVRAMDDDSRSQVVLRLANMNSGPLFAAYFSSPAQWCEAYLKARNLWK